MPTHFIEGPAGSGKTHYAINHIRELLDAGVRPQSILVLVPQRTLARPYQRAAMRPDWPDAAGVDIATVGGLARRNIETFWPLIAAEAGFAQARGREPIFLTIETAQYHMARFVDEVTLTGRFDSVSVPRARLIAQSLDNMAKAAINGFSLPTVAERLVQAWSGHFSRHLVYQTWLEVAQAFRSYCYANNLLDFSLQIEVFDHILLHHPEVGQHIRNNYRHVIADNLEENSPIALDFIRWLWPSLESGLMIYDWDAGYRVFLGAERESAATLRTLCEEQTIRMTSYIQSEAMRNLEYAVTAAFDANADVPEPVNSEAAFTYNFQSFYPQMLDWVAASVIDLVVEQGVQPRDIVLIAPFLNDSLRFSLVNQLEDAQVPIVSHRPSRAIREEPAARAMLTMLQLANPAEASLPPAIDVADTLVQILGMDPIRARLLTQIVYGLGRNELGSFDVINARMQERITFLYGERYEMLREWLLQQASAVAATPPDYFLRSLFGDLAARPDFGFQTNLDAATVAGQLVDSAYSFRDALYPGGTDDWSPVWRVYRELVTEGLLAAFHPESWQKEEMNAVFIAPAYTYLMRNRPVDYQFWIDVGSPAWGERLEQPLTHPYVLRRDYPPDRKWTDEDEQDTNWDTLYRLTLGLVRRCRKQIFLGIADLGEQGFEQRGPLLSLFQQVLRPTGAL